MNKRSTRATTMSCRYLAMLSRRITSVAPDMDLLNDKECFTRPEKCFIKRTKRNMEDTHPFLRDGTTTSRTENSLSLVGWTKQDDTLSAVCIEKVVCMKTKDELYQKVRLTPRVPRVVLKSNSQIDLQDQR